MDNGQHPNFPGIQMTDYGALPLTEERRAYLLPRLFVLLKDFAQLEDLVQPDLEPATTVWLWEDHDYAAR